MAACRVCLAIDTRLHAIRETGMEDAFAQITGDPLSPQDGLPSHLCYLCLAQLSKCATFRDRSQRSHELLRTLSEMGPLKVSDISAIDRHAHKLSLNLTQTNVYKFDSENIPIETLNKVEVNEDEAIRHNDFLKFNDINNEDAIKVKNRTNNDINDDISEPIVKQEATALKETTDLVKPLERKLNRVVELEIEEDQNNDAVEISDEEMREPFDLDHLMNNVNIPSETLTVPISKIEVVNSDDKVNVEPGRNKACSENGKLIKKPKNLNENKAKVRFKAAKVSDSSKRNFKYDSEIDFEAFQKQFNVTKKVLTEEEQKYEIEKMKSNDNYVKSPYRCEFCGKGYNYEDTYSNHMVYHDVNFGQFECGICRVRFRRRGDLTKHSTNHRDVYTCNDCGAVIRGERNRVKAHHETHTGKDYSCPHCDKRYLRKVSRANHMRVAHPGNNVACDECGETFLSARGVNSHKKIAHRSNTVAPRTDLECTTCRTRFRDLEALNKHTSTATDAAHASCKPCVSCGENCRDDEALVAHAAECMRKYKLHCDECDKTFQNDASYGVHYRRKHLNQSQNSYRKRPKHKVKPQKYQRSSDGFVCDLCGKVYVSKAGLMVHIGLHQGIRPFVCDVCSKGFPTKVRLQIHLRTHTGEKPHACARCSRRFNCPANLHKHFKSKHSGVRSYACSLCVKTFTSTDCLNSHIRHVHKGEGRGKTRTTKIDKEAEN